MPDTIPDSNIYNSLLNTVSIEDSFVQATVNGTSKTLKELGIDLSSTKLKKFKGIRITVESNDIRTRDDGGDPTTGSGEFKTPGIYFFTRPEALKLKLIAVGANSVCQFQPQGYQAP